MSRLNARASLGPDPAPLFTIALLVAALPHLVGCQEGPQGPFPKVEPPHASPNSIPDGPLSGMLRKQKFSVQDAFRG